jgi:tetratricopeptide (TPR) repeat protein
VALGVLALLAVLPAAGPDGAAPAAAASRTEADRLWTIGAAAFADGLYRDAARILGRFLETAPGDPRRGDATLLRGQAAFELGDYTRALADFRAAQTSPVRVVPAGEVVFWEAESLFRLRRFADATVAYGRFLTLAPESAYADDALYGLGAGQLEEGQSGAAIDAFRTLVEQHPASPLAEKAAYGAALELVRARRWDEALPLLQGFKARHPASPLLAEVQYLEGVTLLEKGRPADGIPLLERFLAAAPDHDLAAQARAMLGDAYDKAGRAADALKQYQALATQGAKRLIPGALFRAGELARQLGKLPEAEAAWSRLRREHPDDPLAAYAALALVDVLAAQRQYARAADTAREVAERGGPEAARAWLLAAENLARVRRAGEAEQAYARVLADAPAGSPERARALEGHVLLGDAELKAGRRDEAERLYGIALAHAEAAADEHARALEGLASVGDAALGAGKPADAERLHQLVLGRAAAGSAAQLHALDGLLRVGEHALRGRRAADGERAYSLALAGSPDGSPHRFHALAGLGAVAELAGEPEKARRAYAEIVDAAPDADLVRWARGRLRALDGTPPAPGSPGARPARAARPSR